jgi:hypothetical protein
MCSSIETHNHDENKAIELAAVKMIHKPASQLFQAFILAPILSQQHVIPTESIWFRCGSGPVQERT